MPRTTRFIASALLALAACAHNPAASGGSDPASLYDTVWRDFDRNYPAFDAGALDWSAIGAGYRDSVYASATPRETARLLGAMIARLHDPHADLTTPFGTFGGRLPEALRHFSADAAAGYLDAPLRRSASGRILYGRAGGDVGYLYIPSFAGSGWGGEMDDVLAGLGSVSALVIDVRGNGGGDEVNARGVAARLYDRERVYRISRSRRSSRHDDLGNTASMTLAPRGSRHFGGPVALLANRFTASAAEDFDCMLRVLPNVVVVGDPTMGLASHPETRNLPNGWKYRVPVTLQSTADGYVYQFRGLPPTLAVAWSDSDAAAGRDSYLEAALAKVRAR